MAAWRVTEIGGVDAHKREESASDVPRGSTSASSSAATSSSLVHVAAARRTPSGGRARWTGARRRSFGPLAVALVVAFAGVARAGGGATLPVERFRPSLDAQGLTTTESGGIPAHLATQSGVFVNYARNPLVVRDGDNGIVGALVAHRLAADVLLSIGLFDRLALGVDVPITLAQLGGPLPDDLIALFGDIRPSAGTGIGDIRVVPKFRVLQQERDGISLAVIPALTLPTASGVGIGADGLGFEYGTSYLGEGPGAFAFIPEVAVSGRFSGVLLAANLAYRTRRPIQFLGGLAIEPELVYRVGVGADVSQWLPTPPDLIVYTEVFGATPDKNPFGLLTDPTLTGDAKAAARQKQGLANTLEWLAGVRGPLTGGLSWEAGLGTGLWSGFGSPDVRAFVGLRAQGS
jgi:hypothetical protein